MADLRSLLQTVTQAKDETQLRSGIYTQAREYFAAKRAGLFFFDALTAKIREPNLLPVDLIGVRSLLKTMNGQLLS